MANIKSQIKRNRQNEERHQRNKAVRSELKTRVKNVLNAAESGAEQTEELLRAAVRRLDKAAAKGVVHKNQAARRKSRLMHRLAQIAEPTVSQPTVSQPGEVGQPGEAGEASATDK